MARIDKINELLREQIAGIVEKEIDFENCFITILDVNCSPDLSCAKIRFSAFPDNLLGSIQEKLKKNSGQFARLLSKKIKLRKMPRLIWVFDNTEKNASQIDKIFSKIEKGEDLSEESEKIGFE